MKLKLGGVWWALALSACGTDAKEEDTSPAGAPTVPGVDTFEWTANGENFKAVNGVSDSLVGYTVDATSNGTAFLLTIQALHGGEPTSYCSLMGQFTDAVPPPAGTYPVVGLADPPPGVAVLCLTDAPEGQLPGGDGGQVVFRRSEVGHIEGTFEVTGSTPISGGFNVGCSAGGRCGALSVAGTCAELEACCGEDEICVSLAASADDDDGCGRLLSAYGPMFCP